MKRHFIVFFLPVIFLVPRAAPAQSELPVLKTSSRSLDIQDGARLLKGVWMVDPAVALDVYYARISAKEKRVVFISDIDSIAFDVQPGREYDFVVLLNGKDACRTRLSTIRQSYRRLDQSSAEGPVAIPITLRHGKPHLQGTVNNSTTLDLIFDTGADSNVLYPSATGKRARLEFDGTTINTGTGGTTVRDSSRDNRLEIAGLQWDHQPVIYVEKQADAADGIIGYPIFEDKILEIDYDRMVMIVYDTLPRHAVEFAKIPMPFSGSLTAVEAVLANGERTISGLFNLDTGGTGTLMVNRAFAAAHGLYGTMRKLGTSKSGGVGSGTVHNEIARLPELMIAGFTLRDVPIHIELPSDGPKTPPGGSLCMEVLDRFNIILDYSRYEAYFKPNTLFNAPFAAKRSSLPRFLAVVVLISLASLAARAVLRAKKGRRARGVSASPPGLRR